MNAGPAYRIDGLPGHKYGHDGGLARREFQRQPGQAGIRVFVRPFEFFKKSSPGASL